MKISIIAAMDKNRLIGKANQLPWHLPADLKHFKQLTLNKPVIMGRKTFDSIGKPLPQRHNIIITRNKDWTRPDCTTAHSLEQAIDLTGDAPEIMIIGGKTFFEQALIRATHLYLTYIDHPFDGDTYFPAWDPEEWLEIERIDCLPDEKNKHAYSFVNYTKKQQK